VKSLPLVLVGIVANMIPLVTAVLGFFILGERLNRFEKVCILLSFAGVAIMVTGKEAGAGGLTGYTLIAIVALILYPVF
jgi:drug/metabolite transporter (DMT)-like permease